MRNYRDCKIETFENKEGLDYGEGSRCMNDELLVSKLNESSDFRRMIPTFSPPTTRNDECWTVHLETHHSGPTNRCEPMH